MVTLVDLAMNVHQTQGSGTNTSTIEMQSQATEVSSAMFIQIGCLVRERCSVREQHPIGPRFLI